MVIILYFMFHAYATSDLIGSPPAMYDLLKKAAVQRPVKGNQDGSYFTLKSNYALIFGVIQLCSGSGTVFLDQAYWQRAIASRPTTAVKAYILGGLAWFAIPFGFSTTLGLAAVALTDNPRFPTYPDAPSSSDISAGLAASYAASTLLGTGGAVALLIVLFMAVTSCASAELIAVSSLLTFDVYKAYIKPKATPESLIFVSHICICIFGLVMALFACIWNAIGIDLGWLFLVMGLLIGGAVFPAAFTILWAGQSRAGAISGAVGGLIAGLIAWLATAKVYFGEVTVASTGEEYSTLAGNLAAIMTGLIVTVVVSLIKPQNFDWSITRAINAKPLTAYAADSSPADEVVEHDKIGHSEAIPTTIDDEEKEKSDAGTITPPNERLPTVKDEDEQSQLDEDLEEHPTKLKRTFFVACIAAFLLTFIMDFLVRTVPKDSILLTDVHLDPNAHVLLPLHFQQRLLYGVGDHQLHMGLRLNCYQCDSPAGGNSRLLQEVCGRDKQGLEEIESGRRHSSRVVYPFGGHEHHTVCHMYHFPAIPSWTLSCLFSYQIPCIQLVYPSALFTRDTSTV
jgi:urea-proton symporter